jgi:uncharacterized protein YvpB
MKKKQILITFVILLSSILLSSFRYFPNQRSSLAIESASTGGEDEATLADEAPNPSLGQIETELNQDGIRFTNDENRVDLPPMALQSTKISAKLHKASLAKVNKYQRTAEISGSNSMAENPIVEVSSNGELMTSQSQISEDMSIPENLIIRLQMEDQYHSQINETSLPNACGPTALLMVLDYFELEESLSDVIQKHQFSPAQGGYDPYCAANPVCTSPRALVHVAQEEYGLLADAHEGWTFHEVQESLAAGHPIIADIVWRMADEGPGHFVVIYGVDIEQQVLLYHDPYDGAEMTASWEEFSTAWDGPIDLGDPLQPQGYRLWGMSVSIG